MLLITTIVSNRKDSTSCTHLTHLCQVDSSTITHWTDAFPIKGVSGSFYYNHLLIEIPVLSANSVGPDQTPQNAASDLGLHCLPIPFFGMLGVNGLKGMGIQRTFDNSLKIVLPLF